MSPRVPERLSEFLLEEFDFTDGRADIHNSIRGSLVALALSDNGREFVLRALSLACNGEVRALTGEIEQHVLELACGAPGSEVLQFCIETLSSADAAFIVGALVGKSAIVAENPFGREVLSILLERMPPALLTPIVDELPSRTLEMCTEPVTCAGLQAAREERRAHAAAVGAEDKYATELMVSVIQLAAMDPHASQSGSAPAASCSFVLYLSRLRRARTGMAAFASRSIFLSRKLAGFCLFSLESHWWLTQVRRPRSVKEIK